MKNILLYFCLLISPGLLAQKALEFSSPDSLFKYAETNSAAIKTGDEQSLLAKWTKLAAIGNTINLRSPISASWTDNTELPVSYVPAEMFGGPAGTLKELSFGQEFVTNYAITPQIDIINLAAWTKVKSASLNAELTETNNLINKKNLFESVSAAYFNVVSLQEQIKAMTESKSAADSILVIVTNKFEQGIIREQDKNNAKINVLSVKDKLDQLRASLEQQYNQLKLLCDIASETPITIVHNSQRNVTANLECKSSLLERQSSLQAAYMKSELRSSRMLSFAPTVSLIFNQAWQENSADGFFDQDANKFSTQYFGVKVSVPLPFDVNRLSQNYNTKISYNIAKLNNAHGSLQNKITNKQLELDYQKALSGYATNLQIDELKSINYSKSMNQYKEGIISTEVLLLSFTDKVNAKLNLISTTTSMLHAQSKININNTIQ